MRMSVSQFKAQCLSVIDEVERDGIEVVLTRHRRPVARVTPLDTASAQQVAEPAAAWPAGAPSRAIAAEAARLGVDVGSVADIAVRRAIGEARAARWREEEADWIAAYNQELDERGLWSDGMRLF